MFYFAQLLESLAQTSDFVLIYEHASCVHELLKEIDYWVKLGGSNGSAQGGGAGSAGSLYNASAFWGLGGATIKRIKK